MSKLFKKKEAEEIRSKRREIRLSETEDAQIVHSASVRQMDVSEFIRRAALSRKADVDYETEIVLQLSDVVRAIRVVHKAMVDHQLVPPESIWGPIMDKAEAAMLRISK